MATDNNIANIENDWCPNIVLYHGMGDPVLVGADNNIGKLGANMEMSSGQDSLTVNELLQLESVGWGNGGAIMISCIEFKISFQIFYHVDFNLKHASAIKSLFIHLYYCYFSWHLCYFCYLS